MHKGLVISLLTALVAPLVHAQGIHIKILSPGMANQSRNAIGSRMPDQENSESGVAANNTCWKFRTEAKPGE
jgi:hypothetical protein